MTRCIIRPIKSISNQKHKNTKRRKGKMQTNKFIYEGKVRNILVIEETDNDIFGYDLDLQLLKIIND